VKSDVLLPRKTLNEVARLIDGDAAIEFSQGRNHLFFRVNDRLLISRKIDANFPAYERVIPKTNDKDIEFDRDRLAAARAPRAPALERAIESREVRHRQRPGGNHVEHAGSR
jgi:DNA polymerase III sliding clamp (beta) subunit (PCNA family)